MKHKLAWKLFAKHPKPDFMKIWSSLIADAGLQMGRLTTGLHIRRSFFLCKEILKRVKNLKFGLNFNIILIVIDVPVWVRKFQCSHIPNTNGCRSSTLYLHVEWPPLSQDLVSPDFFLCGHLKLFILNHEILRNCRTRHSLSVIKSLCTLWWVKDAFTFRQKVPQSWWLIIWTFTSVKMIWL